MTLDDQLIKKTYYEIFINEHEGVHPIRVLGDLFQEEQKKEICDLSKIRFAQGEVYFHNKDFEAAINKWEHIENELETWARKNMADAYYELGFLPTAEDIYQSIVTDNLTLATEVALQLFSLYIDGGKLDSAVQVIKQTVASNPDYPNVTAIARAFFEEQNDWLNSVELAINEGIRTESVEWFDLLKKYIDKGVTKILEPNYFSVALPLIYKLDKSRFETIVLSIWNSYRQENSYFAWLREINQLFFVLEDVSNHSWHELTNCFKETYFALIDGSYLIREMKELVPSLIVNWLKITDSDQALFASTAVLSWSELFPSSIPASSIHDAEKLFSDTVKYVNEFEECFHLFALIIEWAELHDMGANLRLKWMAEQLNQTELHYVFMAGVHGTGKSSFVNFVLGEDIISNTPTSSVVLFKGNDDLKIDEITDSEVTGIPGSADFKARLERRRNALDSIIECKHPAPFLLENKLAIFDTPGYGGDLYDHNEILNYLDVADTVLFVLESGNQLFTKEEREFLSYIQSQAPETQIHFLVSKMDKYTDEEEAIRIFNEMKAEIRSYLPEAKVFAFSSQYDRSRQLKDLSDFIHSIKNIRNIADKRLAKLLSFIRSTITMLLQKRIAVENQLRDSIAWNEDMAIKLSGALNQLSDLEGQKKNVINRSYQTIKDSMQKEMLDSIPKLLRECSQLIREDSNLSRIHIELNKEMNRRLQDYMNTTILPKYFHYLEDWIADCQEEFEQGQAFLDEMADGFNAYYEEERLKLQCDLKILDDWRRDKDRMTSSFKLEELNILLRWTPAQIFLKGAGKLFGAISQNNAMLCKRYKSFIETEDYSETAILVSKQFFQQFELFEKSLDRDISLSFKYPAEVLNQFVEEAHSQIKIGQQMLNKIKMNPELFHDPLTLFEVRLRQYEWMTVSGKNVHVSYK